MSSIRIGRWCTQRVPTSVHFHCSAREYFEQAIKPINLRTLGNSEKRDTGGPLAPGRLKGLNAIVLVQTNRNLSALVTDWFHTPV